MPPVRSGASLHIRSYSRSNSSKTSPATLSERTPSARHDIPNYPTQALSAPDCLTALRKSHFLPIAKTAHSHSNLSSLLSGNTLGLVERLSESARGDLSVFVPPVVRSVNWLRWALQDKAWCCRCREKVPGIVER
jgi:hypothetical protein